MRAVLTAALTTALAVAFVPSATAATPPSYEQWQHDVREALTGADAYVQQHRNDGTKPSIVLDIDNTALETHYHPGVANKPVLDVADQAAQLGYSILFVTARSSGAATTRQSLQNAGYQVDELCLRNSGEKLAQGKLRCRTALTQSGYTITANIGNRDTDFEGGYYDRKYKLPDYDGALS